MVEFKIELEESLVQSIGREVIENNLQDIIRKAMIHLASQEALDDLKTIDLQNDKEWQAARQSAWEQEKHKYTISR
jgi:hypothetical protein